MIKTGFKITYFLYRYSGALLNGLEFYNKTSLANLGWRNETSGQNFECRQNDFG